MPTSPRHPHHPVEAVVRLVALATILVTIAYVAVADGHAVSVGVAALVGFGGGLMLDRWILRPVVDMTHWDRVS